MCTVRVLCVYCVCIVCVLCVYCVYTVCALCVYCECTQIIHDVLYVFPNQHLISVLKASTIPRFHFSFALSMTMAELLGHGLLVIHAHNPCTTHYIQYIQFLQLVYTVHTVHTVHIVHTVHTVCVQCVTMHVLSFMDCCFCFIDILLLSITLMY